jgi:hypothetical protein
MSTAQQPQTPNIDRALRRYGYGFLADARRWSGEWTETTTTPRRAR